MTDSIDIKSITNYFAKKLESYGTTARGADWNSTASQEIRFEQLIKVIDPQVPYSIIDYGSGFGSLLDYLISLKHDVDYTGFDIVDSMVARGIELHREHPHNSFTSDESSLKKSDYVIASGIFNIKLNVQQTPWTEYVVKTLHKMDSLCEKGFSFNLLTSYSDPPLMREDLYYADPCFYFDYCKRHFSKNVALLHDYGVYDFTILVRKQLP